MMRLIKALTLCTGKFIGIVNTDDILLPDATSTLIDYYKNILKLTSSLVQ